MITIHINEKVIDEHNSINLQIIKTIYKIKSSGEELVVNDGNTYIQIYPTSGNLSIN